jgi:uncharacterized damage-inducible protein DinB
MTWIAPEYSCADEPFTGPQRPMLDGMLDWYRVSLLSRCSGLTGEQLARMSVPPSNLSLLGLVRHLTDCERNWFRRRFAGEDLPRACCDPGRPGKEFDEVDPAMAELDLDRLVAEQEAARRAVADLPLDAIFVNPNPRWGQMSLRWTLMHMIAEYAGHCGHADLIRERIDGKVYS